MSLPRKAFISGWKTRCDPCRRRRTPPCPDPRPPGGGAGGAAAHAGGRGLCGLPSGRAGFPDNPHLERPAAEDVQPGITQDFRAESESAVLHLDARDLYQNEEKFSLCVHISPKEPSATVCCTKPISAPTASISTGSGGMESSFRLTNGCRRASRCWCFPSGR